MVALHTPERGDIIWVNLGSHIGREQSGKCPAVVLSPKTYNQKSGYLLLSLIAPNKGAYPFAIPIQIGALKGVVNADQVRTVDWHARQVSIIDRLPSSTVNSITSKLKLLLG